MSQGPQTLSTPLLVVGARRRLTVWLWLVALVVCPSGALAAEQSWEAAFAEGLGYIEQEQPEAALAVAQRALARAQAAQRLDQLSRFWRLQGSAYRLQGDYERALEHYRRALAHDRRRDHPLDQATDWMNIGLVHADRGDYRRALEALKEALALRQTLTSEQDLGRNLSNIGAVYAALQRWDRALDFFHRALAVNRRLGDRRGESTDLVNLAHAHAQRGHYSVALDHLRQAAVIDGALGDHLGAADNAQQQGVVLMALGRYSEALDHFDRAEDHYRLRADQQRLAWLDLHRGQLLANLGRYDEAIARLNAAATAFERLAVAAGALQSAIALGAIEATLGASEAAAKQWQRALALAQGLGDRASEGEVQLRLGILTNERGEVAVAEEHLQVALARYGDLDDRWGEAHTLGVIAAVQLRRGQLAAAEATLARAFTAARASANAAAEASHWAVRGDLDLARGEVAAALVHYRRALTLQLEVASDEALWRSWDRLRAGYQQQGELEAAIFAGKSAVAALQRLRHQVTPLGSDVQRRYLQNKHSVYRALASLLIDVGRLPEAQQILDLLKGEEYWDFIRRDRRDPLAVVEVPLAPREADLRQRLDLRQQALTQAAQRYGQLLEKYPLSAADEARLFALEARLDQARAQFLATLNELDRHFQRAADPERAAAYGKHQLRDLESLQGTLAAMEEEVALLHTQITPDALYLLLTTAEVQLARRVAVEATTLRRAIAAFRDALQQPGQSPLASAQRLYDYLIAPIADELAGIATETLVVSLDDALRYLPLAALHDGERYLIERYALAVYTPAARDKLLLTPNPQWRAAGLGVSRAVSGFRALAAVATELDEIIRQPHETEQEGVLPGELYLNEAFDLAALKRVLRRRFPVVHIATHFNFAPGSDRDSLLLLGSGEALTLADLRSGHAFDFRGVDLLTLSACNTALSSEANGIEIEGLATLAQRRGAKGVVATLWPVADRSTGLLMQRFYQLRQGEGEPLSKAEALRRAQLALLHSPSISSRSAAPLALAATRGFRVLTDKTDAAGAEGRSTSPYSHPYYWAPFILMGNWR